MNGTEATHNVMNEPQHADADLASDSAFTVGTGERTISQLYRELRAVPFSQRVVRACVRATNDVLLGCGLCMGNFPPL